MNQFSKYRIKSSFRTPPNDAYSQSVDFRGISELGLTLGLTDKTEIVITKLENGDYYIETTITDIYYFYPKDFGKENPLSVILNSAGREFQKRGVLKPYENVIKIEHTISQEEFEEWMLKNTENGK
ncbi:hypothetical protein [Desulfonema magnum]|uniref:Uncharacterized protein n=1 Tax=Desulfonema magnum TaxID=45655 RepID=A0A975BPW7_9BACT|nr:hypothetical protein [Desulfonema magnum]QTA89004.1 Uncharacterized protein dnm_050490 [Desulfonema magnum]